MSKKLFNREYLVRISDIGTNGELTGIEIKPPFNISFDCQRLTRQANTLNITLFGLGKKKREVLSKRSYEDASALVIENGELKSNPVAGLKPQNLDGVAKRLQIELYVCYGDASSLQRIFIGEIIEARNSVSSEGFETRIEAGANILARQRAFTSRTITNREDVIRQLMLDAGYQIGKIDLVNSAYLRAKVLSGSPVEILMAMADNIKEQFYTDQNKAYFVPVVSEESPKPIKVNASSGLMNTPTRDSEHVNFKCMINPEFQLGSIVEIASFVDPTVDGQYEIFNMVYIGDYEGQSWTVDILARAIGATLRL
jgi:hypothetical protein